MATNVFPALDIRPQQQQQPDILGQMGRMMALRQQLQLNPIQLQIAQQQQQTGALALEEQRLKLQSQKAIMDAISAEYGSQSQQTAAGPGSLQQQAPAATPGGGVPTAPGGGAQLTPSTLPTPTMPTMAAPAPSGAGDFLSGFQKVIGRAIVNGALPDDVLGLSGKILQQQETFARMSKTQQDMAVTQNKNAGELASRILAEKDPNQQAMLWNQAQFQIRGNPNSVSLYGPDIANYIGNNPYPGQAAIAQHLGMIQGREAMLADEQKALEVKKTAKQVEPFSELERTQYNTAINDNFLRMTGKPAPPEYLLQPGASQVELDRVNTMAKAVFDSPGVKARIAGAEAWARVGPEVSAEVQKIQARQKLYPDPLVGVTPQLAPRAIAEATKAGNDYVAAQNASEEMDSMIQMMRSGNKLAYSYEPTTGVFAINMGNQSHRINRTEIEQYGGAGSAWDRIVGSFGKLVSGKSVPANIINDMEQVHQQLANNSLDNYRRSLAVTNQNYGSTFQPVVLPPRQAATAPNVNRPPAPPATGGRPPKATHIVPGPDGKLHYTNDTGTIDYGIAPTSR